MHDHFNEIPAMAIPIPNFRAEECAKDLAADVRDLLRKYEPYFDALQAGETLPQKDLEEMERLKAQIASMCELVVICTETNITYRVGDYITARTMLMARKRDSMWSKAVGRIQQWLH